MPEEIDALKPFMKSLRVQVCAGREYYQGDLFGKAVVLVFSRWGKVASASTATELIRTFGASSIVLIGIAGHVGELTIGDIVVATDCVQHDMDARPFFPVAHIPMLGLSAIPTDDCLRATLLEASKCAAEDCDEWLDPALRKAAGITKPCVKQGRMATGDQVISTKEQLVHIVERAPGAMSVDMESAAVAQVAYEHAVKFGCVRIISDGANESIAESVGPFLGGLASAYTVAIVRRWMTFN